MKEAQMGAVEELETDVQDSTIEELKTDVWDSTADFTRHRGAGDFARRRGAHPDPAAKPRSAWSHRRSPNPSTEDGVRDHVSNVAVL
jgi:hypothetical protein